jgi:hypothetical protein
MHFLFNLLRNKGLYLFQALVAHPKEALHQWCIACVLCQLAAPGLKWNLKQHAHYTRTEGVSESVEFKNIMDSKCFHLFSFNTYEQNVYIKEFRFLQFQINPFTNLTH